MKFTLSWLKDHLDTNASLQEIVDTLTRIGLEVESVEDPAAKLQGFLVAQIREAKPHPQADRLQLCLVDAGGESIQVVCGAPNARVGLKSVFAPVGTLIPSKNTILAKGTIRGIESYGMLCSAEELALEDTQEGIMELPADAPIGMAFTDYKGLSDPVIDINITPNRSDAASVAGIARDLAAAQLGQVKTPPVPSIEGTFTPTVDIRREVSETLCPTFILRHIRGLRNGPAPENMQKRLRLIGLRPINALVDITNYITFDRGRPLHVFDASKVKGDLIVRHARAGESLLALDRRTYTLAPSHIVIADDEGVVSLAGIIGGERTGCDETTTEVLIESALWDANAIARTGRALGIVSDARYRFERGVDPDFVVAGAELATRYVLDVCGGEVSRLIRVGGEERPRRHVSFPQDEVKRLTGFDVDRGEATEIFTRLGFVVSEDAVSVPNWRPDVIVKADLVAEILRIKGLDAIAIQPLLPAEGGAAPTSTLLQSRVRKAKRALAALGLSEAITWSFIPHSHATLFGGGKAELILANPIAADMSDMRPSLVPGLALVAERNARRGFGDIALFEVGQIFLDASEKGQVTAAAALRRGWAKRQGEGRHWTGGGKADVFDIKGDVMALLAALAVPAGALQIVPGGPSFLHPGRSALLQMGPKTPIGWFGELHPTTCKALDIEGPVLAFEVLLDRIASPKSRASKARPRLERSDLMPLKRDLAFVTPEDTPSADILKAVLTANRTLVSDAVIFDVYRGGVIEEGYKSIALCVTLSSGERTLNEIEIESIIAEIVDQVGVRTGARLRGELS